MSTILIVDDDVQLRSSFSKLLQEQGYTIEVAASGEQCIERVQQGGIALVLQDIRLPGIDGLETFRRLLEIKPTPMVIIMTAFGTMETAIEATKLGAFDYIIKPFDIPATLELIEKALDAAKRHHLHEETSEDKDTKELNTLLGNSQAMQLVYKAIGRVAPTDATVLIRGESGTGKELVARAIHQFSSRCDNPLNIINCVAIPETLLESELFGYERGAFTGAGSRKIGKIELANEGTVFLDEIGDIPSSIQAKLLRLLQEKTIERLGGGKSKKIDVRILAATNRDLELAVEQGTFREDLYFRLKVVSITLPPLRDHLEDVPALTKHFITLHSNNIGIPDPGVSPKFLDVLKNYSWPGNVRELSNCLQKAIIFTKGGLLDEDDLDAALQQKLSSPRAPSISKEEFFAEWARESIMSGQFDNPHEQILDSISALLIKTALEVTQGNKTKAAFLLGMSRPTLLAKIKKHKLLLNAKVTRTET